MFNSEQNLTHVNTDIGARRSHLGPKKLMDIPKSLYAVIVIIAGACRAAQAKTQSYYRSPVPWLALQQFVDIGPS
jgi:hypothetical protein